MTNPTIRDYIAQWEERIGPVEAERIRAETQRILDSLPDPDEED